MSGPDRSYAATDVEMIGIARRRGPPSGKIRIVSGRPVSRL